jgi:hypothetical protein
MAVFPEGGKIEMKQFDQGKNAGRGKLGERK